MATSIGLLTQVGVILGAYLAFMAFLGFVWWVAWRLSLSKVPLLRECMGSDTRRNSTKDKETKESSDGKRLSD
eukprot:s358_g13.t1